MTSDPETPEERDASSPSPRGPGPAEQFLDAEAAAQSEQRSADPAPLGPPKKKRRFVSPIDLIMLASITLVLGAILVPNWIRARARGQLTACKSNLKNIGTALEMYSTDWSGKYPTSTSVLTPNYLKTLPECPASGHNSYRASFGPTAPTNVNGYEDYYYVECSGGHHGSVSISGDYPAYDGVQGLIERAP